VLLLQSGQNKQPEAVLLLNIRCLLHAAWGATKALLHFWQKQQRHSSQA
jgi:hypothetical protein